MSVRRFKRRLRDGSETLRWIVDVVHQNFAGEVIRVRKVPNRQTRADALALEQRIIDWLQKKDGELAAEASPTLSDFSLEFMTNHAQVNNKPSEVHTKQLILNNHLLPFFGQMRLNAIKLRHIDQYKAACTKLELTAKTINNHLAVLRKMLKLAEQYELIQAAPRVQSLRVQQPTQTFLSEDQAIRLVQATEPSWQSMVLVALHSGLRLGELLALQWQDILIDAGRLVVRRNNWKGIISTPKGHKSREVPLTSTLLQHLAPLQAAPEALVFSRSDGSPLTYQQCRKPLMHACMKAGVPAIQWHGLRHTFASHLAMRGAPLKAIQELLGHTTQAMTERYAHLTPGARQDAVGLLQHHVLQRSVVDAGHLQLRQRGS